VNEQRLGPAYNLERLLVRAKGDVLFPCDQDDIWDPAKIEGLVRALEESPHSGAAICNSSLIDGAGRALPRSLFELVGLNAAKRKLLASGSSAAVMEIARRNVVASHALAVRRNALDLVLPLGFHWHADCGSPSSSARPPGSRSSTIVSSSTGSTTSIPSDCLRSARLPNGPRASVLPDSCVARSYSNLRLHEWASYGLAC